MEKQIVDLLVTVQSAAAEPRKAAEQQLHSLWNHPDYAPGLVTIASHEDVPLEIRQAALLTLKQFVTSYWSSSFDEFKGQSGDTLVPEEVKARIREPLLQLAISDGVDRRIKAAASYAASKIASADYPEQWPDLLERLLHIIPGGTEGQVHGALRVLNDLVEDALGEQQFFGVARGLVKVLYDVAVDERRNHKLRALAVSVFRECLDTLETVMEEHKAEVKAFAEEVLQQWSPFFTQVMNSRLPPTPSEEDESNETPNAELHKNIVALKLQVVKVLMRIRSVFPALLSPQSPALFQATWHELSSLQDAYFQMYIQDERQSRLEDSDGLPYTVDFLVLEELDFMQACLRAPPVRSQLEQELRNAPDTQHSWVTEVMKVAVAYAQITNEEEGLWDYDVNTFLSEESSVTANYTPRTACGDLVIKLGEWLPHQTVEGLLAYTQTLHRTDQIWRAKEAALYVLNQLLNDFHEVDKEIDPNLANGFLEFIHYAMQQPNPFFRARGYLVAGSLIRIAKDSLQHVAPSFLESCLGAISNDEADVVRVSCIRALQYYTQALPPSVMSPLQDTIISAVTAYLSSQSVEDLADSDDLMAELVMTLRDTILLDPQRCLSGTGLEQLLKITSQFADNFQLTGIVYDAFEDITPTLASVGRNVYEELCSKVLPILNEELVVGNLTEQINRNTFAASLISVLAEHGVDPLPDYFTIHIMPNVNHILLYAADEELLKMATETSKNIIAHAPKNLFDWEADQGKTAHDNLVKILSTVDRLLSNQVNDMAAGEVGALAVAIVEKATPDRLGPFLSQLLGAVAVRLNSATHIPFIQSLTLVFATFCLNNAKDVVDFLAGLDVAGQNGLQVVLSKWLENMVSFGGYEQISQNCVALTKIYELQDPRVEQTIVKGDLIVPKGDGRIMTRSRARANPDTYTVIPAPLKILKVLIAELTPGGNRELDAEAAAELAEEGSGDEDWEDEPNAFLDLTSGLTKAQIMGMVNDEPGNGRGADDDTQRFLVDFFTRAAQNAGFKEQWGLLSEEERRKLTESAS